jgi:hypothetical protein
MGQYSVPYHNVKIEKFSGALRRIITTHNTMSAYMADQGYGRRRHHDGGRGQFFPHLAKIEVWLGSNVKTYLAQG